MVVTYELLKKAILNKMVVTNEIASDLAFRVMNYFGFNEETLRYPQVLPEFRREAIL